MIAAVLDTHAVIWLLHGDARLSSAAQEAIQEALRHQDTVGISSISFVETAYLEEKGRIPQGTLTGILGLLNEPTPRLIEVPLNKDILISLLAIPRDLIPDMPDRVIAATARHLSVPLITGDRVIQSSGLPTIW